MKAKEASFLPKGYLAGLRLSNNVSDPGNDVDVASGECVDSTGEYLLSVPGLTKRLDATWSTGNGGGGLDAGLKAINTTYFVHAIRNLSSGAVDVLLSTSASAPTLPSGFTVFRRIGIIMTDASGNIRSFYHNGQTYALPPGIDTDVPFTNVSALYSVGGVPTGVEVEAYGLCSISSVANATNVAYNIHPAAAPFSAPETYSFSTAGGAARRAHAGGSHSTGDVASAGHSYGSSEFRVLTSNGQLRIIGTASATARLTVTGFKDITL